LKKTVVVYSKAYSGTGLCRVMKTTKVLKPDDQQYCRNTERIPSQYYYYNGTSTLPCLWAHTRGCIKKFPD